MRRYIYIPVFIIVFVAVGLFSFNFVNSNRQQIDNSALVAQVKKEISPGPLVSPVSQIANPVKLKIPKINVDANIEEVGNDHLGRMDVPKEAMNVAWYKLGYKVGERGSAVIAGHLDTVDGSRAVFYDLEKLQVGDEILVTTKDGKLYKYRVLEKKVYDFDRLPLQEIFLGNDKARLNLITCDGVFNRSSKNYSKRLVVYSELIS